MTDHAVIEIDQLKKSYGGRFGRRRVDALKGVSFTVNAGEIFGLLGPNGAGKTTLVKILLGIVRQYGGQARLLKFRAGDRRGRRRVGYLPENLRIPGHHNAISAMNLYGQLSGLPLSTIKQSSMHLLEQVGLADRARDSVRKYSKGMLQRLGLAQVLLHDPDVIFLDEPTDGLDPVGRASVRRMLSDLRDQGRTIFLNSHLLQEVEMICDRVAILHRGELKRVGKVEELASKTAAQFQVTFRMRGDDSTIAKALGLEESAQGLLIDDNSVEWTSTARESGEVDRIIDALRAAGISILEITQRRVTLEDVFMELIEAQPA